MTTVEETVAAITAADTWDTRVTEFRYIPQRHGTDDQPKIYATIARELYVPHLIADFAYVHDAPFYDDAYFGQVYQVASEGTAAFANVSVDDLSTVLRADARTLLVFRTICGLVRNEFADSTTLVAQQLNLSGAVSGGRVDAAERGNSQFNPSEAHVIAATIDQLIRRELFSDAPPGLHSKQDKFDTRDGWDTVRQLATGGVPYHHFLHQRHYGGAFRQVLDATSTQRGDLLEDAVQALFEQAGIPHIRTGSHNQGDIAARFQVTVTPAPDFVVFDDNDTLRAMLECKATNDGGTARDKAARFERLRAESTRLGGVPLLAVLGGAGWKRVNDTLGPVLRDTDGRVFTVDTLDEMLTVAPFTQLNGLASVPQTASD